MFGVILGTGVGGGIVVDGHVLDGAQRRSPASGGTTRCRGRATTSARAARATAAARGCIETFLSGPGLARDHERVDRRSARRRGEIARRAAAGDAAARATLERYDDRLARALAHVINVLDPDVIVLGGGLSNIARLYERRPAALGPRTCSPTASTRGFVRAVHGDSSGVRGAAWLGGLLPDSVRAHG